METRDILASALLAIGGNLGYSTICDLAEPEPEPFPEPVVIELRLGCHVNQTQGVGHATRAIVERRSGRGDQTSD